MRNRSRNFLALSMSLSLFLTYLPHFVQAATVIPANFSKTIAGGGSHTLALKSDATVWAWGRNFDGQLGDGSTTDRSTPVQAKEANGDALGGVEAIAGGFNHSIALKKDGTVLSWGSNYFGQLGNGSTAANSSIPVQAKDLTHVVAIAGGADHSIALKNDGTVWTWGNNFSGQLGNGSTAKSSTPLQVMTDANGNPFGDVIAIAGGASHSIALKKDGTVWSWGYNARGQIGDGTTTDRWVPAQVPGLGDVVAIASGLYYSIALKKDGTVWRWGDNLADGKYDRTSPEHFPALDGAVAIAAEGYQIIAIKEGETLWRWGTNGYTLPADPAAATDGTGSVITGFVAASGGATHSVGLTNDGKVWTWGSNYYGQLGNGTTFNGSSSIPASVFDLSWDTPGSNNADLSGLTVSAGTLNPAFAAGKTDYSVSVTNVVYSMSVTPTAADPAAVIQVNGTAVVSGHASAPFALQTGHNSISIMVTASDGTTVKTYTVDVERAAVQPSPFARLIADKSEYRAGDPVEVRLMLDGFPGGAQTNHAHFHLTYDASSFELATHRAQDDIVDGEIPSEAKSDSEVPGTLTYAIYNPGANYPIVNGATVFTVKLRVRTGASAGTRTFTFKGDNPDLSASMTDLEEHEYRIPSVSSTVTVTVETPSGSPPPSPPSPQTPPAPPRPATLLPDTWMTNNQPYVSLNQAVRMEPNNGQLLIRLDTDSVMSLVDNAPADTTLYTIGVDFPGTAIFEIPSALAKAAYEKAACSGWILVHTPSAAYTLPLPVLNGNDGLEEGAVTRLTVSPNDLPEGSRIADAAKANQIVLLPSPAVTYTLTVTRGEETKTIEDLGDVYVERTMRLGDKVNSYPPDPIKPGIFMFDDKNGLFDFSPARFVTDGNGALHAIISRTGNSTYVAGYKPIRYQDTASHSAQSAIDNLTAKGLVSGSAEDRFGPDEPITRAEFVALLVRGLGLQDKSLTGSFADVRESDKYGRETLIAEQERLVFGFHDRFRPNDTLTREEMAVMIVRAMEYVNPGRIFANADFDLFNDADKISPWAVYAVRIAAANGILIADPEHGFHPASICTRAQAVIALERTLKLLALTD